MFETTGHYLRPCRTSDTQKSLSASKKVWTPLKVHTMIRMDQTTGQRNGWLTARLMQSSVAFSFKRFLLFWLIDYNSMNWVFFVFIAMYCMEGKKQTEKTVYKDFNDFMDFDFKAVSHCPHDLIDTSVMLHQIWRTRRSSCLMQHNKLNKRKLTWLELHTYRTSIQKWKVNLTSAFLSNKTQGSNLCLGLRMLNQSVY